MTRVQHVVVALLCGPPAICEKLAEHANLPVVQSAIAEGQFHPWRLRNKTRLDLRLLPYSLAQQCVLGGLLRDALTYAHESVAKLREHDLSGTRTPELCDLGNHN